ncbi:MAG: AbrB/MazE/SpoVT family DNA-binding domain-containing protein [Acidobacteriaceae bacterium]|nr:AbrB/MazE/SpoVT family DNA-binding domain-containing protein [Acidobacteriaceae bacterium]
MRTYKTVVSSKGQVVIPAELRAKLDLTTGTPANWSEEGGRLVLTPVTERQLDEIRGFLKPKPGEPTMFDELFAERQRERSREK